MRICSFHIYPVTLPINSPLHYVQGKVPTFQRIIIELVTDNGIIGYGECRGDALRHTALKTVSNQIIGHDPYNLERLRWIIAPQGLVELFQGSVASHVYSAIEMACLDIIGKSTGRSVSELLGGRLRDSIEMAGYIYYTDENESIVDSAIELVHQYGFSTLKYKCGVKEPDEEITTAKRLREEFPSFKLRLDPNGAWGISTSMKVLTELAHLRLEYLEDPVPSITKLARIHAMNLGTPIGSNQAVASLETMALNESIKSVDIPLIDVNWYGGLRASITAARMAELLGIDVSIHSSMETAISQAAQLHLAASLPNMVHASDTHYIYLIEDICMDGKIPIVSGQMKVPQGPGLGVEVDKYQLNRYHKLWEETGYVNWNASSRYPIMLPRW